MKQYPEVSARKIASYFSEKKFKQSDIRQLLQGEYKSRFKNGLCSGLIIEHARHYTKYRQDENKADFIEKLGKKLSSNAAERSNFMKRIMLYQSIQPSKILKTDINLLDLNEYSIKKLDDKWLLYLGMSNDISAHAISIRTTPKTGNFLERQKYIIFDPNFGEYKANSFDECKDLLEKLMGFYNYNGLLSYDLEEFISKNNLAISTSDQKHTKDHKYIFNNPDAKDAKQYLLISSATFDNLKTLEELLKIEDLDVNSLDSDGNTALHLASLYNHPDVVRILLTRPDLYVNSLNSNGKTALHLGSLYNHTDVVRILLTRLDLDVNSLDSDGNTALHLASLYNHTDVVRILLTRPDLYVNSLNSYGSSALFIASKKNNVEAIKAFFQRPDLDVNSFNYDGNTALDIASFYNHPDVVRILLTRLDLDVNRLNFYGKTALYIASFYNHPDVVRILLTRPDLDFNIKYKNGNILYILIQNKSIQIMELLIEDGRINPPTLEQINSITDSELKSLLHTYFYKNKIMDALKAKVHNNDLAEEILEAIKPLLQKSDLDFNIKYKDGNISDILIQNKLIKIMRLFINDGRINPPTLEQINSITDSEFKSLLHTYFYKNKIMYALKAKVHNNDLAEEILEAIKPLLQRPDLDVNIKYRNGNALDRLIENKLIQIMQLLIEDGRINPPTLEQIHSITDSEFKSLLHAYFYKNKIMEELKAKVHNNDLAEEIDALPEDVKLELVNQLRSEIDKSKDLNIDITTKLISFLSQDFLPYSITPNREPIYHITQFLENNYPHYPMNPYINSYNPLGINNSTSIPIITRFLDSIQQTPEAQINNLSSGLLGTVLLFLTFRYKGTKTKKTQSEENLDPDQLIKQLEKFKSDGVSKADELKNKNIDNKITKLKELKKDDTIPENKKKFILKETSKVIAALTKKMENPYSGIN